jgi:hypothetical protein
LNAWLGGFQSVLNKMTPGNFNWFLHSLLFLHTERVIMAQKEKISKEQGDEEEEEEEVGIDIDRD